MILALHLAIGKSPHRSTNQVSKSSKTRTLAHIPRNRIIIRCSIQIDILKSLRHHRSLLGIIPHHYNLRRIDIRIVGIIKIILHHHGRGKVELRVEGAGAVARLDAGGRGELVHIGGAGCGAVEAFLDAVAFVFDLREYEVDFGDDASDVEAFGVLVWGVSALEGFLRFWDKGHETYSGCNLCSQS